jgi:catechol 2,3-dioxygenase-like lactoylglutathione lyase family enzyme
MPRIDLITVVTCRVPEMVRFYRDVLGFGVKEDLGSYIELKSDGVRLAICSTEIMQQATGSASYEKAADGQRFELAFPMDSPAMVDAAWHAAVAHGAAPIRPPADMPWGQRAAFFADPDGNIHEFFAPLQTGA